MHDSFSLASHILITHLKKLGSFSLASHILITHLNKLGSFSLASHILITHLSELCTLLSGMESIFELIRLEVIICEVLVSVRLFFIITDHLYGQHMNKMFEQLVHGTPCTQKHRHHDQINV